jgi:hypothetical protein
MDLMTPITTQFGPALNRDTVGNVTKAGFGLRRERSSRRGQVHRGGEIVSPIEPQGAPVTLKSLLARTLADDSRLNLLTAPSHAFSVQSSSPVIGAARLKYQRRKRAS